MAQDIFNFFTLFKGLFDHSRKLGQGFGKRLERAEIIVSLDGSGNTDSIQEAINMLPSTGGIVYIKEGDYNITSTITITKNDVTLMGIGRSSRILTTTAIDAISVEANDIIIENLSIDGDGTNSTNGIVTPSMGSTESLFITDCWILDMTNDGIHVHNVQGHIYTGNWIYSNGNDGINAFESIDLSIKGNYINNNTRHGIYLDQAV